MEGVLENAPIIETNKFDAKARELISKLGVEVSIPNIDQTIQAVERKIEGYKLPEAFFDDEVNVAMLVGCGQKLTESSDPVYKKRVDNLIKRLVAPSAAEGTIDAGELWGTQPEGGGLDEKGVKEYVNSKVDTEATEAFVSKYADQIAKAKAVWKSKGYDLVVDTKIVDDNIVEFKKKTGGGGFVDVPNKSELPSQGNSVEVSFVLLKGYSDKDNFVRHELYHVEDYWNFIRRGYQECILESLDELHTEYAAGNYKEDHSKEPFGDSYFTLKQFWDRLSFVGDLDFNLIADRKKTVETIARNFGLDGLVDFALMNAHDSGKSSLFETFYIYSEKPIMDMLISKEKASFRAVKTEDLSKAVANTIDALNSLQKYLTPPEGFWLSHYKSVYNLIPTKEGAMTSASPLENGSIKLPNNEAKHVINEYAKALAFAELYYRGELTDQESLYKSVIDALAKIPHHRTKINFSPEQYIKDQFDRSRELGLNDEEIYNDIYSSLYENLITDMTGVDFAFSLENLTTREQILSPLIGEIDLLAQHCIATGNPDFMKSFVDGLYRFNMTIELREMAAKHLEDNYPELKSLVQARKAIFDSRKISSFSF